MSSALSDFLGYTRSISRQVKPFSESIDERCTKLSIIDVAALTSFMLEASFQCEVYPELDSCCHSEDETKTRGVGDSRGAAFEGGLMRKREAKRVYFVQGSCCGSRAADLALVKSDDMDAQKKEVQGLVLRRAPQRPRLAA